MVKLGIKIKANEKDVKVTLVDPSKKELDTAKKSTFNAGSDSYPGFVPGFTTKGLEGCWQCMTNSTK